MVAASDNIGTPSLSPEQVRRLIELMDDRYARGLEEIELVSAHAHTAYDPAAPEADAAANQDDAWAAPESDDAILRQDMQDVRDIVAARERLASGTYGFCAECGAAIGYPRLLVYPTAKRCVACQRALEAQRGTPPAWPAA